jgi:hypothetical protein
MAATVSTGADWPGVPSTLESRFKIPDPETADENDIYNAAYWPPCGSVLILNNEDSAHQVIRPRLIALGANLSNISFIPHIWHKDDRNNEYAEPFTFENDLVALKHSIHGNAHLKLIIIDPLTSFFGKLDTRNEQRVHSVLKCLKDLASRYNIAIVGVIHLNKGSSPKALYRAMGSLAFTSSARCVWLVSPVSGPGETPKSLFIPVKNNMMENPPALSFEIKDNRVIFENHSVFVSPEAALSSRNSIEAPQLRRAVDWLKNLLKDGSPLASNEILKLASQQCFKNSTLQRARNELGIKCFPQVDAQGNKFWYWKLPVAETVSKPVITPEFS